MQSQADQLGLPVERPKVLDTTTLGVAFLAGLGTGLWDSSEVVRQTWSLDRRFDPVGGRSSADEAYHQWKQSARHPSGPVV